MTAMSTFRAPILKLGVSCRAAIVRVQTLRIFQYANDRYPASGVSFISSRFQDFVPFFPEFGEPSLVRRFALFLEIRSCILAKRPLPIRLRSCFRLPRELLPHRAQWTTGLQILLAPTADFPHRHIFATEKVKSVSFPRLTSSPTRFVLISRSSAAWA